MRVPKIGIMFLGGPMIRTFVLWGLNWGPPILGNSLMRAPGLTLNPKPRPLNQSLMGVSGPGLDRSCLAGVIAIGADK